MFFKKKKESNEPAAPEVVSSAAAVSSAAVAPAGVDTEAGGTAESGGISVSGAGNGEISGEIIAVIAAAIAALTESSVSGGLIVRKISRIHGEKVSWSNAGLMECIDSRRF